MKRKIGVEESMSAVREALVSKGYEVITLKTNADAASCDACVITGQDENVQGVSSTETQGPVIDARGMSADDVCESLSQHFR